MLVIVSPACSSTTPTPAPKISTATSVTAATKALENTKEPAAPTKTSAPIPTDTPKPTNTPEPVLTAMNLPVAFKIADTVGSSAESLQMAMDGQGNLHVVWFDNVQLLHRQLGIDGNWSEVEKLVSNDSTLMPFGYQLLSYPDGRVCLLRTTVIGLHERCYTDGHWTGEEAISTSPGVITSFTAEVALDGSLQILSGAVTELKLGNVVLTDQGEITSSGDFAIDKSGGYHVVWVGAHDALRYRYSSDNGKTWQPAIVLSDAYGVGDVHLKADSQGGIHLLYSTGEGIDYRHWSSAEGWGSPIEVLPSSFTIQGHYDVAIDSNGLAYIILNYSGSWSGIGYLRQDADGGWSDVSAISIFRHQGDQGSVNFGDPPTLIVGGKGELHFVWPYKGALYYAKAP